MKHILSAKTLKAAALCATLTIAILVVSITLFSGPKIREISPSKKLSTYLTESPAVISGVVKDVKEASWIHASKINGAPVQLFRLNVGVENVLQGQVPAEDIVVYCYIGRGNQGGIDTMGFVRAEIYVFYLRKDSGEWRTACDLYEHCVDRVLTGFHPHFKRNPARPLGDDILELLFTRGVGVSDGVMVDAIASRNGYGRRWREEREDSFISLLQKTARTEAPAVRAGACEQLSHYGIACDPPQVRE